MGVLSDEDLVVMRTRARHRMLGVLALVVLLVVGVPMLLDHQEPPANSSDEAEAPAAPPASTGPIAVLSGAAVPAPPANASPGAALANAPPAASAATAPASKTAAPPPAASSAGASAAAPSPLSGMTPSGGTSGLPGAGALSAQSALPSDSLAGRSGSGVAPLAASASAGDVPTKPAALVAPLAAGSLPTLIPALSTSPHRKSPASVVADARSREPATATATARTREAATTGATARTREALPAGASGRLAAGLTNVVAEGAAQRGWFVQFGVFAETPRAEALVARLAGNKVLARSELIHGPRGNFTRVRSGPFSSRASADEVLARVKTLGENAILVHQ